MSERKNNSVSVIYLHGRPSAHPIHQALARTITNEFGFVDEPVRWQDRRKSIAFNIYAWFANAIRFKNRGRYNVFLIDNLHVTFPIMKMLGLLKRKQKIIVHLGSHTLYFMYAGKFSRINLWIHKLALQNYDALICEGRMAEQIAKLLLKEKCPPTYTTFLGPQKNRSVLLKQNHPNLESNTILIIGAGPEKFREFYKGLDLMFDAFKIAFSLNSALKLIILGDWSDEIKNKLLEQQSAQAVQAIRFVGPQSKLEDYLLYLGSSAMCLHCSRGDAFPTSTIETMAAGLPTIVSEWTGTKELAQIADNRLIVPLEATLIAKKIKWYFDLSKNEKQLLSDKSREATINYNEEDAINFYKETFKKICDDLKL